MRAWLRSMTWRRKPAKLPGPALPVSTAVVTPDSRQKSSASMLMALPPQYTWVWRSIRPGVTTAPARSRTTVRGEGASVPPKADTRPSVKATSHTPSWFCDGSMTRPFFKMRSWSTIGPPRAGFADDRRRQGPDVPRR